MNLIFTKKKKYEFRKIIPKNNLVKKVIIYATAPIKKVVGEFEINKIISLPPNKLWLKKEIRTTGGIEKKLFDDYFKDKKIAHAIEIKYVIKYSLPISLNSLGINGNHPPQSFMYITKGKKHFCTRAKD